MYRVYDLLKNFIEIGVKALTFFTILLLTPHSLATPSSFVFQGQIVKPNGDALEENNVSFLVQVLSSMDHCLLYEESFNLNMIGSKGVFNLNVGSGINTGNGGLTNLSKALDNSFLNNKSLSCAFGSSYTPTLNDTRRLRVTFDHGSGPLTLTNDHIIHSVPYAQYAGKLGGKAVNDFIQVSRGVTQSNLETVFDNDANQRELMALINGSSNQYSPLSISGASSLPSFSSSHPPPNSQAGDIWYNSTNNQIMYYNGSAATVVGKGSGTVTSITAGSGLSGGTITNSGTILIAPGGVLNSHLASGIHANKITSGILPSSVVPTGTDNTKLPLTGGVLLGDLNFNNNQILNTSHIMQNPGSTMTLGSYTNLEEVSLLGSMNMSNAGATWYNSDSGALKYWNGVSLEVLSTLSSASSVLVNAPLTSSGGSNPTISINLGRGLYNNSGNIDLDLDSSGGLEFNINKLKVKVGSGLKITPRGLEADIGSGLGQLMQVDTLPVCTSGEKIQRNPGAIISYSCVADIDTDTDTSLLGSQAQGDLTGTYPNPSLIPTGVTQGAYPKVRVDVKGRVVEGLSLLKSDIPDLNGEKITSGTISTARLDVGTGSNQLIKLDSSLRLPAVDGSRLINLPSSADNMGDSVARLNINLNQNYLSGDGDNEGIIIDASGRVGVGKASPEALLDVAGTARITQICDERGANCKDVSEGWSLASLAANTVTYTPFGNIQATDVEGALNELESRKAPITRTIRTALNSGLSGGGDLSTDRSLSVDINKTTEKTTADSLDSVLMYDVSQSGLKKITHSNFLNGYLKASLGKSRGNAMDAGGVPSCESNEKLQMSEGPIYLWSCEVDQNTSLLGSQAQGDLTGTYPNPSLIPTGVTPGTYPKVRVDVKGRVVEGLSLLKSDIPDLNGEKITSGTISTARLDVGTGSNQLVKLDSSLRLPAVDGSQLINLPSSADNMGDGIARLNINLNQNYLSGDGDNEGIIIDANGRVGVGKASPEALLDVAGTARITQICDERGANCKDVSEGWSLASLAANTVTYTPFGNIQATDVEGALNELESRKAPITRTITTALNSGLSGGGDLSTNRSLSVDINKTTEKTTADSLDSVLIYDVSQSGLKKITHSNFLNGYLKASLGKSRGNAMDAGGVPSCESNEKLQMSEGPIYSWSCEVDQNTSLLGSQAQGDLTGTYPNPSLTPTGVTPGTYPKVRVDVKGRVVEGLSLLKSDIPDLNGEKITSGTISTARLDVGTGSNQLVKLDSSLRLPAVDGSRLINLPSSADNMGDSIARLNINLNQNYLSGDGDNEGIIIDASGRVGVGKASPEALLDVAGTARITQICDERGANCKDVSEGWSLASLAANTVTYTPFGNIQATDVEGALNELESRKAPITRTIRTALNSGLSGGGDLSTNRSLSVDINKTTEKTTADSLDSVLMYDVSQSGLKKITHSNFLNGYLKASLGKNAGNAMDAGGVPNCESNEKLQMSEGPIYLWSCVTDTSLLGSQAQGDLTGTYPNPSLIPTGVTQGTYPKVRVDVKGRVVEGLSLLKSDIPDLNGEKITSGTISTARLDVGTGSNQLIKLDSSLRLPAVDGSRLINLPSSADNMGDGRARLNINLNQNYLSGDGDDEGITINNNGDVSVSGSISTPGSISTSTVTFLKKVGTVTTPCDSLTEGTLRYNSLGKKLEFCDGVVWKTFLSNNDPTISITNSLSGSYINSINEGGFRVLGTCSEDGELITFSHGTSFITCSNKSFSGDIDFSSLSDGPLSLTASITNIAGNSKTSGVLNLIKDTKPPIVSIGSHIISSSNSIDFPITVSQDFSSINLEKSNVSLTGTTTGCTVLVTNGTTINPSIRISDCSDETGNIQITIASGVAQDAAGNLSDVVSLSTEIQNLGTPFTAKFRIYGSDLNLNLRLNSSYTYNFMVNWGDGTSGVVTSSSDLDKNHTYSSSGTYIVKITGRCPYLNFRDSEQIIEVTELGDTGWESFSYMFYKADNLTLVNGGSTRHVTSMNSMFSYAALANPDTSNWDTSKVTSMGYMFSYAALANPDTSNWDTSKVTSMGYMFSYAALANPDTSDWDTSKVTSMSRMFLSAALANPDTSNWDTSKVTSMSSMFYNADLANPDTSDWDTSKVTSMSSMFYNADLANPDTSDWDTSKVTSMYKMFSNAALANPDTSDWDTSKVTDMRSMFSNTALANPDTSNWDTSKVTDMRSMFSNTALANPDTSNWDTSKVTNMGGMFYNADLANPDTSNWDTSKVTDMSYMFNSAALANPDTSNWDTSKVTSMNSMFNSAALANPDTSDWDTSKVTAMNSMFNSAALANPDTSDWDTSKVTSMSSMFYDADLANPDTSNWDTSKVTSMGFMFYDAASFDQDISLWNVSNVVYCGSFSSRTLTSWTRAEKPNFTRCSPGY